MENHRHKIIAENLAFVTHSFNSHRTYLKGLERIKNNNSLVGRQCFKHMLSRKKLRIIIWICIDFEPYYLLNSCKYHMKKKAWLPNTVKIFFSILYIAQRFESWTPIPDLIPYIPRKLYANFGTFV